jgi:thiol:disulfide interchange protein DsbC
MLRSVTLAVVAALSLCSAALANEAVIRKALAERLPNFPAIDEVRPSPVPGLFEVRFGSEIRYTDAQGLYLFEGDLIDLRTRRSLTQERIDKLSAVPFNTLPLNDAIVWKRGTGARKLAVFADPNCGYCKRFEAGLQEVDNVTVYTFLIPILGPDSRDKSRAIWCAKDNTAVWQDWMLRNKEPAAAGAKCDDAAIARNAAFAQRHQIRGTPALLFEDGSRVPGAIPPEMIEERLKRATAAAKPAAKRPA